MKNEDKEIVHNAMKMISEAIKGGFAELLFAFTYILRENRNLKNEIQRMVSVEKTSGMDSSIIVKTEDNSNFKMNNIRRTIEKHKKKENLTEKDNVIVVPNSLKFCRCSTCQYMQLNGMHLEKFQFKTNFIELRRLLNNETTAAIYKGKRICKIVYIGHKKKHKMRRQPRRNVKYGACIYFESEPAKEYFVPLKDLCCIGIRNSKGYLNYKLNSEQLKNENNIFESSAAANDHIFNESCCNSRKSCSQEFLWPPKSQDFIECYKLHKQDLLSPKLPNHDFVGYSKSYCQDSLGSFKSNYQDPTSSSKSNYQDPTSSSKSNYQDPTGSSKSNYQDLTSSSKSNYHDLTSFSKSNYQDPTGYSKSNYQDPTGYSKSNYQDPTSFSKSHYQDPSSFSKSNYQDPTGYSKSNYQDPTSSSKSNFQDLSSPKYNSHAEVHSCLPVNPYCERRSSIGCCVNSPKLVSGIRRHSCLPSTTSCTRNDDLNYLLKLHNQSNFMNSNQSNFANSSCDSAIGLSNQSISPSYCLGARNLYVEGHNCSCSQISKFNFDFNSCPCNNNSNSCPCNNNSLCHNVTFCSYRNC